MKLIYIYLQIVKYVCDDHMAHEDQATSMYEAFQDSFHAPFNCWQTTSMSIRASFSNGKGFFFLLHKK